MAKLRDYKAAIRSPKTAPARRPPASAPDSSSEDNERNTKKRRRNPNLHNLRSEPKENRNDNYKEKDLKSESSGVFEDDVVPQSRKRKRLASARPAKAAISSTRSGRERQTAPSTESVLETTSRALENARRSGAKAQQPSTIMARISNRRNTERKQSQRHKNPPATVPERRSSNRLKGRQPKVQQSDGALDENGVEGTGAGDGSPEPQDVRENADADAAAAASMPSENSDASEVEVEVKVKDGTESHTARGQDVDDGGSEGHTREGGDGGWTEGRPEAVSEPPDITMTKEDKQTTDLRSSTATEISRLMGCVGWSGKRTWKVVFRQLQDDPQSGLLPVTAQGKGLWSLLGKLAAVYAQTPQPVFPSHKFFQPLAQHAYLLVNQEKLQQLRDGIRQRIIEICDTSLSPIVDNMTPNEGRMRALLCEDLSTFVIPQAAALLETTLMLGGRDDDDDICLSGFYVPLGVCQMSRVSLDIAAQAASWLSRLEAALAHELGYRIEYGSTVRSSRDFGVRKIDYDDEDSNDDDDDDDDDDNDDDDDDDDKNKDDNDDLIGMYSGKIDGNGRRGERARFRVKQARRRLHVLVNRVEDDICRAKIELERKIRGDDTQLRRMARWKEVSELERQRATEDAAQAEAEAEAEAALVVDKEEEVRIEADVARSGGRAYLPSARICNGQATKTRSADKDGRQADADDEPGALMQVTVRSPDRLTTPPLLYSEGNDDGGCWAGAASVGRGTEARTQDDGDGNGNGPTEKPKYGTQELNRIMRHLKKTTTKTEPDLTRLAAELGRDLFDVAHQAEVIKGAVRTLAIKQQIAIPRWARAGYRLPGHAM